MILVDTNVVSELIKPQPSQQVVAWFNLQVPDDLCICSTTVMEMLDGVGRMPVGNNRTRVDQAVNSVIPHFKCLPFDEFAARSHAQLTESARRAGLAITIRYAQIAAVAHSNGITTVATRDTGPFIAMGLTVIDPFV
jgi:toxin FitB